MFAGTTPTYHRSNLLDGLVAQTMLEAIRYPDTYSGRSFDLRAKPVGEGTPTVDFEKLMDMVKGKSCDYSLGVIM